MTTITISVDSSVEQEFRKRAAEAYEGRKGYLGDAITEAMEKWLAERKQKEITQKALELWKKGHNFGKLLYKKRDELYAR